MAFSEKPPPLIDRLRSILDSYPFSTGLFRELIQNSDDARATEQVFVLDHRSHPTDSLYNVKLAVTQGPALLAYNDALFNNGDWLSLQNLERSLKKLDESKIGKFGMGFRSCYHITDTPQILSGSELAILDPQKSTFEEGGVKYDFIADASHADQLSGFDWFIPAEARSKSFGGTIIRLPLRSAPGSIRDTVVRATEMRELLVEFIKAEIDAALLFLSCLTSIEVYEINNEGRNCLVKVRKTVIPVDRLDYKIWHPKICATSVVKTKKCSVTVESSENVTSCTTWRVIFSSHAPEISQRILSDRLKFDQDSTDLGSKLSSEKLLPHVSLAIPLSPQPFPRQGRLYTFLPLPLITGFPAHIHGLFALDSARQHLRADIDPINPQSTDKVRAEWNRVLFDTFIPFAWAHLLPQLVEDGFDDVYHAWPPQQADVIAGDAHFWGKIPSDVLDTVIENDLAVWPIDGNSREYKRLSEVHVVARGDSSPATLQALRNAGLAITELPHYIFALMRPKGYSGKVLTPEIAHKELMKNINNVRSSRVEDLDLLIEFLLSTNELSNIVNLPAIRLTDESRVSLRKKDINQESHVLMSAADVAIFGACDPSAIELDTLPSVTRRILRSRGPMELNVIHITAMHVEKYLRFISDRFLLKNGNRPDSAASAWLSQFWEWFGEQSFKKELYSLIESFYLIPTAEGDLECAKNGVVYFAPGSSDMLQLAFSLLNVPLLSDDFSHDARRSLVEFGCVKDPNDVNHILTRATLDHEPSFDSDTSEALLKHFVSCIPLSCQNNDLSDAQQRLFRSLPIFPLLSPSPSQSAVCATQGAIPNNCSIVGVKNVGLLPIVQDVVYLDGSRFDLPILHFLPALHFRYTEYESPTWRIISLAVEHFPDQNKDLQLAFLEYIISHPNDITVELSDNLKQKPFILACDYSFQAPVDIVDPDSGIGRLFEHSSPRLPSLLDETERRLVKALRDLNLLEVRLTPEMVLDRIGYIDSHANESPLSPEVYGIACQLLTVMNDATYIHSKFCDEQRWLPLSCGGIAAPNECRDRLFCPELFDEVLGLVKLDVTSASLRKALGWDEDIPFDVIKCQLKKVAMGSKIEKLSEIILHMSKRDVSPKDIDHLYELMDDEPWIPIVGENCIVTPDRVIIVPDHLAERLPFGFFAPQGVLKKEGVQDFLRRIGCPKQIPNAVLLHEMGKLPMTQLSSEQLDNTIRILENIQIESLSKGDRLSILVPDRSGDLRLLIDVLYNDLDDRACLVKIPDDKYFAHPVIGERLARKLAMETLRAFSLESEEGDDMEDMGEKIQMRIQDVLLEYKTEQAFGEFLANAIDAGATSFGMFVDEFSVPPSRHILTNSMDKLVSCPALLIRNDAIFTEEDFIGIRRVGTGGKRSRSDTIGHFGLGSLAMFHFTEMVMILSRDQVLFLDPSKNSLADVTRHNWLKIPLTKMRRLYQGHLEPLYGLFGFTAETDYYDGTLIRLPLRTPPQADRSVLSKTYITVPRLLRLVEEYREIATQSFFFTEKVLNIRSSHRLPDGVSVRLLWHVSGIRAPPQKIDDRTECQFLEIPGHRRETWLIARTKQEISTEFTEIIDTYRLRSPVMAGLAARMYPPPTESLPTKSKFFSTLPLMVATTLPVHCHGTFVLAPDRRSIRFDGDGRSNLESEYNQWLLSNVLPHLYFFLLEELLRRRPNFPWWPGSNSDDPLSRCLVQSFYLKHLALTGHLIFPSATQRDWCLPPRDVMLSRSEPRSIEKIWRLFRCAEVVKLPESIQTRAADGGIKCVDPTYMSTVIRGQPGLLSQAFSAKQLHFKDIRELIFYLFSGETADVVGLPLIPLSNGTLGNVALLHNPPQYFFWKPTCNDPAIIPPDCLVHHDFDEDLSKLFAQMYNVSFPSEVSILEFIRTKVSESPDNQSVSVQISRWIEHFWEEFESLKLTPGTISSFPLVCTIQRNWYISIDKCKTLPVLLAQNVPQGLVDAVSQLGAVIVPLSSCPSLLRKLLEKQPHFPLDFKSFLRFIASIEPSVLSRFRQLRASAREVVTEWIVDQISKHVLMNDDMRHAARLLPIWRSYSADGDDSDFISAKEAVMLPMGVDPNDARWFLDVRFIEYSQEVFRLNGRLLTWQELYSMFHLPEALSNDVESYKRLVSLSKRHISPSTTQILVPRHDRTLVKPKELFSRRVDLFWAALQTRPNFFVHELFKEMEEWLWMFGMKNSPNVHSFTQCVEVFHEDTSGPNRRERAAHIWRYYCDQLPLLIAPHSPRWSEFSSLQFIPRGPRFRSLEPSDSVPSSELPDIVAPNNIMLPGLEKIVWTQRVSCFQHPSAIFLAAQPNFGVPTVSEVVEHLRILAVEIAPLYPSDETVLGDLKATYKWLNDNVQPRDPYIRQYHKEPLFLNVDDPNAEEWTWRCANNLLFDFNDSGDQYGVKSFLEDFKNLLLAAGAEEFSDPACPNIEPISSDEVLQSFRAGFDGMRIADVLVDIEFKGKEEDAQPCGAHRIILCSQSNHFMDSCQSDFREGQVGSGRILVAMKDHSTRCIQYVIEYIYTGYSPTLEDQEEMWEALQLTHYWELARLHLLLQKQLIVSGCIPLRTADRAILRQRAEAYNAQVLLKACDEFEKKNAGAIRRLESEEDHERSIQLMLDSMLE